MKLFYVTFGCGSRFADYYYTISASDETEARQQAFNTFGNQWAFIYSSPEKAGISRFHLKEIIL